MKPFDTIEQLVSFFLARTTKEIVDSEVFRKHLYNGYEFEGVYIFQVANKGYVLKCITPNKSIFTIDRTGEIRPFHENMVPSDRKTVTKMRQQAADRETDVGDIRVSQEKAKAKQDTETAKAEEQRTKAYERRLLAWVQRHNDAAMAKTIRTAVSEMEHFELMQLSALLYYEKCMLVVQKHSLSQDKTSLDRQELTTKAQSALVKLFDNYVKVYKTSPKMPPKGDISKKINELVAKMPNTSLTKVPFGKTLNVEYFMKVFNRKLKNLGW